MDNQKNFSIYDTACCSVPLYKNFSDKEIKSLKKIVIAIHGFGSNKKSRGITALAAELEKFQIGLVSFDLPSHGDNKNELSLAGCLNCISQIENFIRKNTHAPICFWGSSFGAYLTLLHLSNNKKSYGEVVLRVPAIGAYKDFVKNNYKESKKFLNELKDNNVFTNAHTIKETINIIYAEKDTTVDNRNIFEFAEYVKCNLSMIENAKHKLGDEIDRVIDIAVKCYTA